MTLGKSIVSRLGFFVFLFCCIDVGLGIKQGRLCIRLTIMGDDLLQVCCYAIQHLGGYYRVFICKADGQGGLLVAVVIVDVVLDSFNSVFFIQVLSVRHALLCKLHVRDTSCKIFCFKYLAVYLHIVYSGIGSTKGIFQMGSYCIEADSQFCLLIFVAELGYCSIFPRYAEPHYYCKECGCCYSGYIRIPFQCL